MIAITSQPFLHIDSFNYTVETQSEGTGTIKYDLFQGGIKQIEGMINVDKVFIDAWVTDDCIIAKIAEVTGLNLSPVTV